MAKRRKVNTVLYERAFHPTKVAAAHWGEQIKVGGVVAQSWGALALARERVRELIDDEDSLLDS